MAKAIRNRASRQSYQSPGQLTISGFETPFVNNLDSKNRWVVLADQIPWDVLVGIYTAGMKNQRTGAGGVNPRVVLGSLIIKHMCNLSDRQTVQHIQENLYMQYFIGYSSFSNEIPFDPSLFVEFRKRLGADHINLINEKILGLGQFSEEKAESCKVESSDDSGGKNPDDTIDKSREEKPTHKGKLITDATACPQDIAFPTDLNLLNDARMKSEEILDEVYDRDLHDAKPRNYRNKARKQYLKTAQKKVKSKKVIRKAVRQQLNYVNRNLKSIDRLLDSYDEIPLDPVAYKYLLVIRTLYDQQKYMYDNKVKRIDDRIVSIHQPHVRPMVRGKVNASTEFGAKIQVSLMQGYAFLDELSWDAFNEGTKLISTVRKYKHRFGYYPEQVLADKIYCTRKNRKALKELGVKLRAKPLGRPKANDPYKITPGERNPIEGFFGQAKSGYGMNRIKARLKQTSESWIASIVMVLNLVKLAKGAHPCHLINLLTYSAQCVKRSISIVLVRTRNPALLDII